MEVNTRSMKCIQKELESDLLDGVTYNLEFEYQIPIVLDDFRVMYFNKNGGGDNLWEENLIKTTEISSGDNWKKYSSALASRANHGNWGGKGQVLRIHFGGSSNQDVNGEHFGKPLNVKVKKRETCSCTIILLIFIKN